MRELSGLAFLSWLTFRRQILARKSIVARAGGDVGHGHRHLDSRNESTAADDASTALNRQVEFLTNTVVVQLYVSFLLPILVLTYATAAIGGNARIGPWSTP